MATEQQTNKHTPRTLAHNPENTENTCERKQTEMCIQ